MIITLSLRLKNDSEQVQQTKADPRTRENAPFKPAVPVGREGRNATTSSHHVVHVSTWELNVSTRSRKSQREY